MEQFKDRDVTYVMDWLKKEGFKEKVVKSFESNEVDGNAFILLSEKMMKELVPAIGPLTKLVAKYKALQQQQPLIISSDDERPFETPQVVDFSSNSEITPQRSFESLPNDTSSHLESTPKRIKTESNHNGSSFKLLNDKYTKSLPDPFKFPENYSPLVSSGLSSENMIPHTVEKFITEIARAGFTFKYYPLPEEFSRLAQQCVQKYPFLASTAGGHGHIEEGIKKRYKEFRRTPRTLVLTRVCDLVEKEKESNSEDEVSYGRNVNALQAEARKSKPNLSAVSQLMDITFQMRRSLIEENPKHVSYFLEKFPALTIYDQFIEESQRVLKIENLKTIVLQKWTKAQSKVIDLSKRERHKSTISELLSDMDSEEYELILPLILLMYIVPTESRQKLNHESIIMFIPVSLDIKRTAESVASPTPTLLCCLELQKSILVIDKTVVLELPIEESVLALLSSYFVFNIGYPKGFHRYFMLLEILLLDKKQAKSDHKIDTVLSCLKLSAHSD